MLRYPGDRMSAAASASGGGTPAPSPKRIATIGDSNTEGFGLTPNETYPARLNGLLGTAYTVDNYGVGGTTCAQVSERWDSVVASRAYGVVVLMCGTNDVRLTSDSTATIYARISALMDKVKATKARVVLMTVLPAGSAAGYTQAMEERRVALNAAILATSGVTVINLEPLTAGPGSPPTLAQSFDGLHLNATSALTVATAVHSAL
jgi:lysophospholipase L1-like esterase